MGNVKIVMQPGAPQKLRKLPAVQGDLKARADRIRDRASESVDGFESTSMIGATRARASVAAVEIPAMLAEATDHVLLKALDAGR